ncbi:MAG TPA: preprotein translocase subunit YajC [Phycisphaerales bacterium]|nr:preprotein translocase subunit YajC [Phycisphaerales bacterium]
MLQTTPAPSTPAAQPPAANITRSDGVVGGAAPVTGSAGTVQPDGKPIVPAQQQGPGGGSMLLLIMMPLALVLIWFMGSRADKKRKAEHAATLAGLQRNDKVQTIGGIIGNVAEMSDTEVVLRVDEITNTRVRVSRQAISSVLNRAGKVDSAKATA